MDDYFKGSLFAIVFRGDEPACHVVHGWTQTLARIRKEITGDGTTEPWEGFTETLNDPENWSHNDFGPFAYQTEFGDGGNLQIFRAD